MRRAAFAACLLLSIVSRAAAQAAPPGPLSERPALGIFVRPALDGFSDPWFIGGWRLSLPVTEKAGLDLESAMVVGGQNEFSRVHGLFTAQVRVRFRRDLPAGEARYWLAGIQLMPGDTLLPNGAVRERHLYSAAVAGIGGSQRVGRYTRVFTEASFSGGDGFIVAVTAGLQWGPPDPARR